MIAKTRHRFHQLRRQPEHVRLRAAVVLSAVIGSALAVISLAVLLPLQLYLLRDEPPSYVQKTSSEAQVGGASDTTLTVPAPSPSPTAAL